jgi:hypothetical protein
MPHLRDRPPAIFVIDDFQTVGLTMREKVLVSLELEQDGEGQYTPTVYLGRTGPEKSMESMRFVSNIRVGNCRMYVQVGGRSQVLPLDAMLAILGACKITFTKVAGPNAVEVKIESFGPPIASAFALKRFDEFFNLLAKPATSQT